MADLIDRQAAIKAIEDLKDCYNGFSDTFDKACIIGMLEEVPSAQPERTGRWMWDHHTAEYVCSECGKRYEYVIQEIEQGEYRYCPNCGAKMEGEDDAAD